MTSNIPLSFTADNSNAKRAAEELATSLRKVGDAAATAADATDKATVANKAAADGAAKHGQAVEKTTARLAAYSRETAAFERSIAGSSVNQEKFNRLQEAANRLVEQGRATREQADAALERARQRLLATADATQRLGLAESAVSHGAMDHVRAMDAATAGAGRLRGVMGNLSYQVQDVAVQLAGGQNALLVFAQQGSQMAGALGPAGATLGAVIAVAGGLAMAFGGLKSDTERLEDATKSYDKAASSVDSMLKDLVSSGRDLRASHGQELSSVAALEAQYRSLSGTMRELEALRLQVERNKVVGALADQRTTVQALMSDLDGLETAVANVLDFQKVLNERRKALGADALGDMPGSILKLRDALVAFKSAGADDPEAIARLAVSLNETAKAGGPLSDTAKRIAESLVDPARNSADLAEKLKLVDGMTRVLSGTATSADKALINMGDAAGKAGQKVRTLDDVLADVTGRGMADDARETAKAWELIGRYIDKGRTPAERYREEVERVQGAISLVQDRAREMGAEFDALSPQQLQTINAELGKMAPEAKAAAERFAASAEDFPACTDNPECNAIMDEAMS